MSEPKLISPMLDNFDMGDPISEHDGVCCCPAMEKDSDNKYIVKIISIPASQTQLDALLLTGAYPNEEAALSYFKELADGVSEEIRTLQRLSQLEGFLSYENSQTVPMEGAVGYDVYLLGTYKSSLERFFSRNAMTHLGAINLGLDLCAALAVCRRAGYLYVDLKPSNVFVIGDKEYRIGDLGFVRLDSLKYASLPEKYRSPYTAPEVSDVFASLNETIDTYAVGLILYQAYNNGELPIAAEDGTIPAPEYADYEMAEIILKACAPDPDQRWKDPIQMGQALVNYMQRNGANDTPIVPPPVVTEDALEEEMDEALSEDTEDAATAEPADTVPDVPTTEEPSGSESVEEPPDELPQTDAPADSPDEELLYGEDSEGNLTFLLDLNDETDPGNAASDITYEEVSEEVSEILAQVDELAALPVPEPVVAPEPIEIPVPEPLYPADDAAAPEEEAIPEEEATPKDDVDSEETVGEVINFDTFDASEDASSEAQPVKKKSAGRWVLGILIALAIIAVAAAGFLYYRYFYLLPIDSISLEGNEDTLIVQVNSNVDESLLTAVCSDSHGNQITVRVMDGKAVFENLVPNTAYNIKLVVAGFHRLTGDTSTAYSTPAQTSIVQFSAVTGAEDGSVILGFTVDGPDAGQWSVVYSADGEEARTVSFPSHMVTLNGLTVGKEYTFKLISDTDLYVTGTDEIKFTASKLIYAQDLVISSFVNGKLTASWSAPEGVTVSNWTVRCYSENEYNETMITSDTTAVFEGLDHGESYTVEVTAAGMSVSQRAFVAKNAVTATNFQADASDPKKLIVTWETDAAASAEGWHLLFTVDGSGTPKSVSCNGNRAVISPVVPGASYSFTLQDANGSPVLSDPFTYRVPEAQTFSSYNITAESMRFDMYKAPDVVYTNTFASTDNIYLLITLNSRTKASEDSTTVLFVIRDESGNVIEHSSTNLVWNDMWTDGDCILAIPYTPETAGKYAVCIYFNGQFVTEQNITIQ